MSSESRSLALDLEILRQPDDASCGQTCLHAVYRYFGETIALDALIPEVPTLESGGTLAVNLANHALRRGYGALIYTYNLHVFDPSWFETHSDLASKLREQSAAKHDRRLSAATDAYLEFLALGGELAMEALTPGLLRRWLERDRPILTGLSATFLYRSKREVGTDRLVEDDIRGVPTGHFVVLSGWDAEDRTVRVADPLENNPRFPEPIYWQPVQRVINAILLGVLTYDANLLVLEPPETPR
jgi:hypothetical protein